MPNHYAVVFYDQNWLDRLADLRPLTDEDREDAWSVRIDCSDPANCPAWQECREDHTDFDTDDYCDGDEAVIHGEDHVFRESWGWTVDYPGCAVIEAAEIDPDQVKLDKPRVYLLDIDWNDTECYVEIVKELK